MDSGAQRAGAEALHKREHFQGPWESTRPGDRATLDVREAGSVVRSNDF